MLSELFIIRRFQVLLRNQMMINLKVTNDKQTFIKKKEKNNYDQQ